MRLEDIRDPKQRAMFAAAAGLAVPRTVPIGVLDEQIAKAVFPRERSPLEVLFLQRWTEAGGPRLEEEVELVPERSYRVDFLHEASHICFEIQGYRDHSSRKGMDRDCEKILCLRELGYSTVILTRKMIAPAYIERLVRMLK